LKIESKQDRTITINILFQLVTLILIISLITMFHPESGMAEAKTNLIVLPFQINASEDLSYLDTQITSILARQLEKDGATLLDVDEGKMDRLVEMSKKNIDGLRELSRSLGADQVVWGSFTLIGDNFSMDAQLLKVNASGPAEQVFVQGRNIENLLSATQELASRVSIKLFPRELVADIRIEGNRLIEDDAILRLVKTQVGAPYQAAQLSQDLHAIYQMGYFDDIRIEVQSGPEGKFITFHVTEKPNIRRIQIYGNSHIDEEKIRENLTLTTGAILNLYQVRKNIDQIKSMYREKNYYNVEVSFEVKPVDNHQADLEFVIKEGAKVYVTQIAFEGNQSFEAKQLRKIIQTKEKGLFFFLTESGDLDNDVLGQDVSLLTSFYQNHGYMHARVGEPKIDIKEKEIHITFKIEEGPQYKVRNVDISGDLIKPKDELLKLLSITKETYFNREVVHQDVLALTDVYQNQGYAYAQISPRTATAPDELAVDITYTIRKQQQVFFENITISGNKRTRDKVIRRELKVIEEGLYDNQALKRSVQNLYRLDYFDDIKIDTVKGSADDKMNLNIEVAEKSTANFTFGIGYSDEEYAFVNGSIAEQNFLGKGQTLKLSALLSGNTTQYDLTFIEPWLFDIPLYFKVMAYDQDKAYTGYDRETSGAGLTIGYRVWDFTNFYWGYKFDKSDIIIDPDLRDEVQDSIKDLEGNNITSSTDLSLVYDSRNRRFSATEGSKHSIYFEYAGLGGDIGYNKLTASSQKYFPLYKVFVGFLHGKIGYVYENDPQKFLPDYEKFYLGGISSMRGFGYQGVAITEISSDTGKEIKAGGNTMILFNAEILFPLLPQQGVQGFLFYDTGNVYGGDIDLSDLRQSAGLGIRWLTVIAPLQLVYGWILDRRDDEPSGRFEFSFGGSF